MSLDLLQHHVAQVEYALVRLGIQMKNVQAACLGITMLDLIATVRVIKLEIYSNAGEGYPILWFFTFSSNF